MAKSPTPALRLYEAQSAPRPQDIVGARATDQGQGIGASLSRVGAGLQDLAQAKVNQDETSLRIAQQEQRDREDAGRIQAAQRMAEFRTQTSQMRQQVFEGAPNGYENATHTAATNFGALQQQFLSDGVASPEANRFFHEASNIYQSDFLESVAGQETQARDQYQADSISETADTNANILIGDPGQYDRIHTEMTASLGGIHNPNLRRDAEHRIEHGLAAAAVSGLISRDPGGMLHRLQAAEPDPMIARLGAPEREQAIRSAQSEIQRRTAQAQTAVAQAASTAMARYRVGLDAPGAPSFDSVYSTLGPDAALEFETVRLQGEHTGELSGMTSAQLAGVAASSQNPSARGDLNVGGNRHTGQGDASLHDAIRGQARAQAARAILQERQTDPMQQQVRQGLVPQSDIVGAVAQGDWGMVNGILANRAAAAQTNGARLGMPAAPLTAFEARQLGPVIQSMTAQNRGTVLRNFAAWTGGGAAYNELVSQLFPNAPSSAYAGYITGLPHNSTNNGNNAALILRGEDLLARRDEDTTAAGGGQGRPARSASLVSMPSEDRLRRAFMSRVGDAYDGLGTDARTGQPRIGTPEAREHSYQVFRAAYAGLSEQARDFAPSAGQSESSPLSESRVANAVRIATGGVMSWGGHNTVVPPGFTANEFSSGVRSAFARVPGLQGLDPSHYSLRLLGGAARGGNSYIVYNGKDPLMSPAGNSYVIEVRP